MKVSFENPDKINAQLTITVEEDDYKNDVEKTLKDYRKKVNMPGFRPGQVPMGLVKRQYGMAVKMDAINNLVGREIQNYIRENKIQMLGEPLASEKQEPQELEKPAPYTFTFDIAVAPEINIELGADDKIDYYDIDVDEALVDRQVEMFASRLGKYEEVETYQAGDLLRGDLRELDENGNTKEGGLTIEEAVLMPSYIKADDQKKLFDGAKAGDIITFNPRKAYPESDAEVSSLLKIKKEEIADHSGDFSYQVTKIEHFQNHEVNQELFDAFFGEGAVKDEKEFRTKIAEGLKMQVANDSDYKFQLDLRKYAEDKVGQLTFPDTLLKRIMLNNNKDKDQAFVDKNYEASIKELAWSLMRDKLAEQFGVKVQDEDVKAVARAAAANQFAQYGMNNVPEEYLDNYVEEMMKKEETVRSFVDHAIEKKLCEAVKKAVTLNKKTVSMDEFNKLLA